MAAAVQEPAAAEAAISATAAAPDAEVPTPAPSLVTTEEAGLQDVLEEVVGEQGTDAVPTPAVSEQAALMQWEEDADADDQQEVAAEQVQYAAEIWLCRHLKTVFTWHVVTSIPHCSVIR
jgi:hypothetical protein